MAVAGFLFIGLPLWASGIWALFMSEPLIPWLGKQNIPVSTDLALWLKILASIFGFALLCLVSWALWGSRHRDLPGSTATQRLINDDTKIPEPQAVFVAIDQLKALFGEGRQMETFFQVPERPNPTINAVLDWIGRVNTCARQKDLKGLIGPKDLKSLTSLGKQTPAMHQLHHMMGASKGGLPSQR